MSSTDLTASVTSTEFDPYQYVRYTGTFIEKGSSYGFIDRTSVKYLQSGLPADLDTTVDIYAHEDDSQVMLADGCMIVFSIVPDARRKELVAYRAEHIRMPQTIPFEEGIEVHFPESVIDHPMVPITWCIKPDTLECMRNGMDKSWTMILIAQEKKKLNGTRVEYNPKKTVIETINGIDAISDGEGYLTFYAPGDYDLVAYLVSSNAPARTFWYKLSTFIAQREHVTPWKEDMICLYPGDLTSKFNHQETIIAFSHMNVSIPTGIFAKPIPEWIKTWLSYFSLSRPRDECSLRGRIVFAFTLGLILYLIIELLKRTWMTLVGIGHFVCGGNPFPVWKGAFTRELSSDISDFFGTDDYEDFVDFGDGWYNLCRPFTWIVLTALAVTTYLYPKIGIAIIIAVSMICLCLCVGLLLAKFNSAFKQKHEVKEKDRNRDHLARIETYAACGTPPQGKPRSVRLFWSGVKRMVCRSYGG